MDQRLQLVQDYRSGLFTMTELAEQYGISRKTGYKWIGRTAGTGGVAEFADRSRRPHHSPGATAPRLVAILVALRKRHPRWGARKLLALAATQHPTVPEWPSRSTVCEHLTRAGLVVARGRRAAAVGHAPSVLAPITAPNGTWTTDFKGEFRTGDGRCCYPLTLRDGYSRFVLRCDGLLGRTLDATQRRFARAFAKYGLPDRIRSDNGGPFAGIGLGRLSRLAVWWMRLGIVPERIAPGRPDQNGSHEQFHAVLKAHTARPPAAHLRAQQRRFARFCAEYNHVRPHEALGDAPPATYYTPSRRALPSTVPAIVYPGHLEVRRVSCVGSISWRQPVFLTESLAGEWVGFEEVDDGLWTVYFGTVPLARFDERRGQIHPLATITTGARADKSARAVTGKSRMQNPNKLLPMSPD
jgi:transposase InsO family protein